MSERVEYVVLDYREREVTAKPCKSAGDAIALAEALRVQSPYKALAPFSICKRVTTEMGVVRLTGPYRPSPEAPINDA